MEGSQLKLLMDYTIFHLGTYITLTTLLLSFLGLKGLKTRVGTMRPYLEATLMSFLAAGLCGGIVAASLPYFKNMDDFTRARIGPFFYPDALPALYWTYAEHSFFWIGIGIAVVGIFQTRRS
jgi:hypothetical protein